MCGNNACVIGANKLIIALDNFSIAEYIPTTSLLENNPKTIVPLEFKI